MCPDCYSVASVLTLTTVGCGCRGKLRLKGELHCLIANKLQIQGWILPLPGTKLALLSIPRPLCEGPGGSAGSKGEGDGSAAVGRTTPFQDLKVRLRIRPPTQRWWETRVGGC